MSGTRLGCPETLREEDLTLLNPYQIDLLGIVGARLAQLQANLAQLCPPTTKSHSASIPEPTYSES